MHQFQSLCVFVITAVIVSVTAGLQCINRIDIADCQSALKNHNNAYAMCHKIKYAYECCAFCYERLSVVTDGRRRRIQAQSAEKENIHALRKKNYYALRKMNHHVFNKLTKATNNQNKNN